MAAATALALAVAAGGWLWLRDSSLVSVEHVKISGVRGANAKAIDLALSETAKRMSTMKVNLGSLRAAVAAYPEVREVHATTSFPHSMRITVREQPPVATLIVDGERTAIAADGAVLGGSYVSPALPLINGSDIPTGHVSETRVKEYLSVLAAAPRPLQRYLTRVYTSQKGITVKIRGGMLIYFGDASRPHAKWLSFAQVLTQQSAAGATYIDVRLPERPAAGMPDQATGSAGAQTDGLDPTSAALAESLAGAVNGESSPTTGSTASTQATTSTSESESSPDASSQGVAEEAATG